MAGYRRGLMGTKATELTEQQFLDMTKIIKIISESVKTYLEGIKEPKSSPGNDVSLYAMQVLSLMCGLNRGYTKQQLDQMWETSTKLSNKMHATRKGDQVQSQYQSFSDSHYKN